MAKLSKEERKALKRKLSKEERKELKAMKKLKKKGSKKKGKDKKRKLAQLQEDDGDDMKVESPKSKKRKLSSDSDSSDSDDAKTEVPVQDVQITEDVDTPKFDGIAKVIVGATKEQLQNALLLCAKQTPSSIKELETNLVATDMDVDLKQLLESERETASTLKAQNPFNEEPAATELQTDPNEKPTEGKSVGTVLSWKHERGFGFIKMDDEKELFCHAKELYVDPPGRNAKIGTRVEFYVTEGDKGQSATEVSAVGGGSVESGRQAKGTCSNWNHERQFGFITGDDGSDIFIGDRDCWTTSGAVERGDRVEYDIKVKQDGRMQATYCTLEGGLVIQCGKCEGYGHTARDCGTDAANGVPGAEPAAPVTPAEPEEPAKDPTPGKTLGTVISWKHEKGFGFLKTDDEKELFCHANEVWVSPPHRNARVGSRVEFEVTTGDKGEAATGVSGLGGVNAKGGRQMKGTVANWLADRGFGFITGDDGAEYFIPDRDLWEASGALQQGDRVEFDIKVKADGRTQATYCTLEGGEVIQCRTCEGVGHSSRDCPGDEEWPAEDGAEAGAEAEAGGAEAGGY